jgi:hypothetical protein
MNIRRSIFAFVVAIVLTAQGLSYWLIRDLLVSMADDREVEKVGSVGAIVESMVAEYAEGPQIAVNVLSSSERLAQALGNPSAAQRQETFTAVLKPLLGENHLDILEVTDDREIVRYSAQEVARNGDRANAWGV